LGKKTAVDVVKEQREKRDLARGKGGKEKPERPRNAAGVGLSSRETDWGSKEIENV